MNMSSIIVVCVGPMSIYVRTCESAFSWCLKKSSMVLDDRISSLLDAVSVRDRVDW